MCNSLKIWLFFCGDDTEVHRFVTMDGERILNVLIEILGTLIPAVAIAIILGLLWKEKRNEKDKDN